MFLFFERHLTHTHPSTDLTNSYEDILLLKKQQKMNKRTKKTCQPHNGAVKSRISEVTGIHSFSTTDV